MAKHGSLGEFDQRTGDWKSYIERARAQQYFAANDVIDADKQRAILLSSVGDKTYRTIKDVLSPDAPATVVLATLIKKMTQHFQPAPSEIVQHFRFNTRVRQPHESVATQGRIQAFVREGARIAREARGKIRPRPLSMTTLTKTSRKRTQTAAVRLVFNVFGAFSLSVSW